MAAKLHVAQQAVAAWEKEVNEPHLVVFERIAAITGVTPEWLAFAIGPTLGPQGAGGPGETCGEGTHYDSARCRRQRTGGFIRYDQKAGFVSLPQVQVGRPLSIPLGR